MVDKFKGSLDQLKALIANAGIDGKWSDDGKGKHSFRSRDNGILNWWPSKGTIQLQGPAEARTVISEAISSELSAPELKTAPLTASRQIFIVHGHDTDARDQLELALHRLDLEPFVLMNTAGGGKTIIEALEGKIGHDYSSDFGIVLMTPDDFGYDKNDGPDKAEPRARQNVILEAGMLLSSLTRARMAIIVKGHLEMPTDLQGIIYFGYNDHIREIVPKLCERLRDAGFDLTAAQIAAAAQ
jgi:predicted nucleotide-binding protein